MRRHSGIVALAAAVFCAVMPACGSGGDESTDALSNDVVGVDYGGDAPTEIPEGSCVLATDATDPLFAHALGCLSDFDRLASRPLSATIPGASTSKTLIDRADSNALYFTNATKFPMHWDFASAQLSGHGKPIVPQQSEFQSEYLSPARRFLLGAVTRYDNPGIWAYEIEPWDTSTAEMVTTAYDLIAAATFFGAELYYHPTSDETASLVKDLPSRIKVITNDQLFAGVSFLPLNPGVAVGQLRFFQVADLEAKTTFVSPRDVAVLDRVPNDISAVAGLITAQLQTPLSHVNVLSQNRGTPNMALVGAQSDARLTSLKGKWVRLTVTAFDWKIEAVTQADADAWWEAHKPPAVKVPDLDLDTTDLRNVDLIAFPGDLPAFGGKATNYGELARMDQAVVSTPKAFAIPVYYYKQFETQNGFDTMITALLADSTFGNDPAVREAKLADLRTKMLAAPVDATLLATLQARCDADFPGQAMRFRSSTNAEDLDGFTGAGLYESNTYDPGNPAKNVATALRQTWSSLWDFRAFEERSYRSIDQRAVAMGVLCHRSFPVEDANGVGLTANVFNAYEPAFYINAQKGDASVVRPDPGVVADQFLYYFYYDGHPMTFLGHSSLIAAGQTVLTGAQVYELGQALDAIHNDKGFKKQYQHAGKFYAMDVEFKFNTEPGELVSRLFIKQARPHQGWSSSGQ